MTACRITSRHSRSVPRACGDEPQLLADPRIMEQCSPRVRGRNQCASVATDAVAESSLTVLQQPQNNDRTIAGFSRSVRADAT
jgi:hypothetical protein